MNKPDAIDISDATLDLLWKIAEEADLAAWLLEEDSIKFPALDKAIADLDKRIPDWRNE